MRTPTTSSLAAFLLSMMLAGCAANAPLTVLLVRHGEKTDRSADPELSAAGRARAELLAGMLRDAQIERIHSSDFIRTRDTAAPAAQAGGIEVELYDPRNLPALVDRLRREGGRHLVVGHSNTTPTVVELLGGEPGPAIDETREYDRLYVVTIGPDGTSSSVMIRFGEQVLLGGSARRKR